MNKFLKLSTWKTIIRSRIIRHKNSKTEWYKERMKICLDCHHSSKHSKPKTFKERVFKILNLNKHFCLVCGCSHEYKNAIPEVECSLTELNEKPKWRSIINTKYKEKYENNSKNK